MMTNPLEGVGGVDPWQQEQDSKPSDVKFIHSLCARIAVQLTTIGSRDGDLKRTRDSLCIAVSRITEMEDKVEKYKWLAEHDIHLVPKDDWHTPGEPDQRGGFAVERRLGFILTRLSRCYAEQKAKP